jgi:pyrroloquinoline quinone biosynthesis protein B
MEEPLKQLLTGCDALLLDGTFWSEHEMEKMGAGTISASAIGHLPVSGSQASLAYIAALPIKHKVSIHVNNTNPMLVIDSPTHKAVQNAGVEIGQDGMEITL